MSVYGLSCLLAVLATYPGADPQQPAGAAARPRGSAPSVQRGDDTKAIADLVDAFTAAFNAANAPAASATFTEDALVVDEDDVRTEGRAAIQAQLAQSFAENPGRKLAIKTQSLRFLGGDSALEEGVSTVTSPQGGAPEVSRFTVVYVKKDGRWLQAAVRDELQPKALTAHDHLKELEWLVGDWVNESQDAVVHTTCKWTADGNFLVREFTMKTRGEPVLSGTQRIGWDPTRRQFKTWVFDSEGGFGEGYWTRNGNQWVIKAEGTRQDGQHASATNIITQLGKDRASWQSVDRTVGGEALPGINEFTIVRKPPEVAK
jgi:uncharacterized protein (TIGR02246 family)